MDRALWQSPGAQEPSTSPWQGLQEGWHPQHGHAVPRAVPALPRSAIITPLHTPGQDSSAGRSCSVGTASPRAIFSRRRDESSLPSIQYSLWHKTKSFVPRHTELLTPLEVGTIGCCQVRAKMLMPWNKWFYKPPSSTVFIDTQTLDKRCFWPHHIRLVQKDPPIQAGKSKGHFAVLTPRQAQCINRISG